MNKLISTALVVVPLLNFTNDLVAGFTAAAVGGNKALKTAELFTRSCLPGSACVAERVLPTQRLAHEIVRLALDYRNN